MGAIAQLSTAELDVEPGRSASLVVTVRNTGTVVDRFNFEAIGSAAPWVTFSPETLSLFPEASGTVTAVFAPPRLPTTVAGPTPFAIRVSSSEDPAESVVEEGTVTVAAFSDITVELLPRVTRGRRTARTQLAVDNRSNCIYRAEFVSSDPQSALAIGFRPPMVDAGPGEAAFAKLLIKPKRTFWRGPPKTQPFRVTLQTVAPVMPLPPSAPPIPAPPGTSPPPADAAPARPLSGQEGPGGPADSAGWAGPGGSAEWAGPGGSGGPAGPAGLAATSGAAGAAPTAPVAVIPGPPPNPHPDEVNADGSMMQESLLPSWFFAALAALLALIILFVILWFTLFKPQIKSTAQNEVNKGLVSNGLTPATGSGAPKTGAANSAGGSGSPSGGSTSSTTAPGIATGTNSSQSNSATRSVSLNGSMQATGNGTRLIYAVPKGDSLQVTDLLVENSAGNTGTLSIARNGGVVMQWAMANFRDLDYHWITPVLFSSGSQMQLVINGCNSPCSPGIYYAGNLLRSTG